MWNFTLLEKYILSLSHLPEATTANESHLKKPYVCDILSQTLHFILSNESLVLSNDNRRLEKSRPIHSSSKFSLYRWQQTGPHLTLQNVDGCILLQEWEGRVQIKERERTHLILMWESGMLGIWHHKIRMPSAGEMGGEWQDERREWTWNGWQKE